jgi:hypothetical protein
MAAYFGLERPVLSSVDYPWFIDRPESDLLLNNPRWIAAAREAFSAEIVHPLHCTVNLNGPSASTGPAHQDVPAFRGFSEAKAPIWLLNVMSRSRLFLPWLAPVASGLAWFYRGQGGEFEYWPDGPERPSVSERPPLWNYGVMSDNEVMWHRVAAIGSPDRAAQLAGRLSVRAKMHLSAEGWSIVDDGRTIMSLEPDELRISLLWKAYVFKDEAHLRSFENKAYDLDVSQVVDIFMDDLGKRGVHAPRPADPLTDEEWTALLQRTYPPPFD